MKKDSIRKCGKGCPDFKRLYKRRCKRACTHPKVMKDYAYGYPEKESMLKITRYHQGKNDLFPIFCPLPVSARKIRVVKRKLKLACLK